jgi:hypothetical protein
MDLNPKTKKSHRRGAHKGKPQMHANKRKFGERPLTNPGNQENTEYSSLADDRRLMTDDY